VKEICEMNIGELAAFVCSHLFANGIKCVLSGGACVSIYTNNEYQSYDIDFIENHSILKRKLKEVLGRIGFTEDNRYFRNIETKFFIEFPTGPLSIASEPVNEVNEIEFPTGKLFLLTPTDCVKDRLCAYYFWGDLQSLEQAINISKHQKIDIDGIQRWSESENKFEAFEKIRHKLSIVSQD